MIEKYNSEAYNQYNTKSLEPCPNCSRTFLPDSLNIHVRSCMKGISGSPLIKSGQEGSALSRNYSQSIQQQNSFNTMSNSRNQSDLNDPKSQRMIKGFKQNDQVSSPYVDLVGGGSSNNNLRRSINNERSQRQEQSKSTLTPIKNNDAMRQSLVPIVKPKSLVCYIW